MLMIVKCCLGKEGEEYKEILENILVENEFYRSKNIKLLHDSEVDIFEFMIMSFNNSSKFPDKSYLEMNFPNIKGAIDSLPDILELDGLLVYRRNKIAIRLNEKIHGKINEYNQKILEEGVTEELWEKLEELKRLSVNINDDEVVGKELDIRKIYEEKMQRPLGMITGIKEVDDKIGGMNEGTITTIAGYTSHFKTTMALNIAYLNSYMYGYNLIYLSLETPKEDMYFNFLCRHSYSTKFSKYSYIPHDKIRKCELSTEELDYLYNVVEPDLKSTYIDKDGYECKRGRVIIWDESDLKSMSFTDIMNAFEKLDDELGGDLDGFIIDYVQLCKFADNGKGMDDNRVINGYVTFFRRMTQKFRYGEKKKRLIGVLLAQINRTSWSRAKNKAGRYDLTCLADANELERGSYRVFTTYTTEEQKAANEAQVQILKNRSGPTMWDPVCVFADGSAYVFGEMDEGFNSPMGGNLSSGDLGSILSQSDDLSGIL
jgi:replicative DNA helicase